METQDLVTAARGVVDAFNASDWERCKNVHRAKDTELDRDVALKAPIGLNNSYGGNDTRNAQMRNELGPPG